LPEYLLDTDHLSYVQEGHPQVVARLNSLGTADRVFTSVVNVAELLRGVYLMPEGRRKRELLQLYRQVIGPASEVLPLTLPVGERFAETDTALRRKGRPIPINDVWVAALTLVRGAILVTNDTHFSYVDDLITENWTV
jgi:tRNA(fMet)-specific endonuclease VapC